MEPHHFGEDRADNEPQRNAAPASVQHLEILKNNIVLK
jgi:hypothetical protein